MYIRTFFFLIFIISSAIFFLSSYNPSLTLNLYRYICEEELTIKFIQLTSMIASALSVLIFAIANNYTEKKILAEKKQMELDRLNMEQIHAELKSLQE